MVIHRDESMMYYVYIRKIDAKKFLGFAVAINGYYITQISALFSLFEKQVEFLVERGIIINYSKSGDLMTSLSTLLDEEEEVLAFSNYLHEKIINIKTIKKLPLADYTVSINSQRTFSEKDNNSDIIKSSYTFGFTIILKQENYDTLRSTSYRNTLKQLNATNESLTREIEKLKKANKQIQRQKNQFKKVIFLFLTVIACGVGIYLLYENLNDTQEDLNYANNIIKKKNSIIKKRDDQISVLKDSIINLHNTLKELKNTNKDLSDNLQKVFNAYPFIVNDREVDAYRFKFKYYCDKGRDITVTLKAINTRKSEIISNDHTFTLYKGGGEESLDFKRKLDSSYHYYIVLIYDDRIIAGMYW